MTSPFLQMHFFARVALGSVSGTHVFIFVVVCGRAWGGGMGGGVECGGGGGEGQIDKLGQPHKFII